MVSFGEGDHGFWKSILNQFEPDIFADILNRGLDIERN